MSNNPLLRRRKTPDKATQALQRQLRADQAAQFSNHLQTNQESQMTAIFNKSRRGFLQGATVALGAITAPLPAQCLSVSNRHAAWVEEWRRTTAEWEAAPEDSAEDERLTEHRHNLEERICSVPAANKDEALTQMEFYMNPDAGFEVGSVWKNLDLKLLSSVVGCLAMAEA